ncbi:MAG: FCD domain-containing protein [Deltaproteobacteria bacterium]|nr:MAG: FCD domain-containing protein [Deltaproteobacteria bacterium]
MPNQSLQAFEDNLDGTRAALDSCFPGKFFGFGEQFHDILVGLADRKHLSELYKQLRLLMLRYRSQSVKSIEAGGVSFGLGAVTPAFKGHLRIFDCPKNGDMKGIESALVEHLDYAKQDIQSHVFRTNQPVTH